MIKNLIGILIVIGVWLLLYMYRSSRPKYVMRIKMNCITAENFDTLDNVLLSNTYSDLGGKQRKYEAVFSVFTPTTVYAHKLPRNKDGFYYLDRVEKGYYEYLYVEGNLQGNHASSIKRKLSFDNMVGDTIDYEVCMDLK